MLDHHHIAITSPSHHHHIIITSSSHHHHITITSPSRHITTTHTGMNFAAAPSHHSSHITSPDITVTSLHPITSHPALTSSPSYAFPVSEFAEATDSFPSPMVAFVDSAIPTDMAADVRSSVPHTISIRSPPDLSAPHHIYFTLRYYGGLNTMERLRGQRRQTAEVSILAMPMRREAVSPSPIPC